MYHIIYISYIIFSWPAYGGPRILVYIFCIFIYYVFVVYFVYLYSYFPESSLFANTIWRPEISRCWPTKSTSLDDSIQLNAPHTHRSFATTWCAPQESLSQCEARLRAAWISQSNWIDKFHYIYIYIYSYTIIYIHIYILEYFVYSYVLYLLYILYIYIYFPENS